MPDGTALLVITNVQMCTAQRFTISGIWCCVVVREAADISKDHGVFIFKAKGMFLDCLLLKIHCHEMNYSHRTQHHITQGPNLQKHYLALNRHVCQQKIYFCRYYRPDVENFISCYFCALPFTDIVTVALAQSSVWIMTQNER